jgi:hypothetical protein
MAETDITKIQQKGLETQKEGLEVAKTAVEVQEQNESTQKISVATQKETLVVSKDAVELQKDALEQGKESDNVQKEMLAESIVANTSAEGLQNTMTKIASTGDETKKLLKDGQETPEEKAERLRKADEDKKPDKPTKEDKKGKGIFSKIGGMFSFFGKIGKLFGSKGIVVSKIFPVLKFLFKALGGIALIVVGAGVMAFLNSSPADRKAMIDKAMSFIGAIGELFTTLKNAFTAGFSDSIKGIKEKSKVFVDKMGDVYEKIKGWVTSVDDPKSGLSYYVNLLGNALGSFIEGILTVGNFLADMIIDPTVTMAKLKAGISNGLNSMGATISEYLGTIFSKEGILKMLKNMLGPKAFKVLETTFGISLEDASKEASADRKKQIENTKQRNKDREVNVKQMDELLKLELAKEKDRDDATVSRLQYQLEVEKGNIETSKATLIRLEEKQKIAAKVVMEERVSANMSEEMLEIEEENRKTRRKIAGLEHKKLMSGTKISADTVGANLLTGIGRENFTEKTFRKVMDIIEEQSKGTITAQKIAEGTAELSKDMINAMTQHGFDREDIEGRENQMIVFSKGVEKVNKSNAQLAEINVEKLKLEDSAGKTQAARDRVQAKLEADDIKNATGLTGGLITKSGLAKIHQGELLMDNKAANMMSNAAEVLSSYLPTSGTALNDLQLNRVGNNSGGGGGDATVVTDASSTVINNTNATINPSPRGQTLPDEGRDFVSKVG